MPILENEQSADIGFTYIQLEISGIMHGGVLVL